MKRKSRLSKLNLSVYLLDSLWSIDGFRLARILILYKYKTL